MFFKYSVFENVQLLSISRNPLQTPSLHDILLGNFTLSNSITPNSMIGHYAGDIVNNNITGKY